jgi:hypothetical protein
MDPTESGSNTNPDTKYGTENKDVFQEKAVLAEYLDTTAL